MHITGNEAEEFPLKLAAEWTANYRKAHPKQLKGHLFGSRLILRILGQPDCLGIRIYYALDDKGVQQLILCGVDHHGNDLENGIIGERSYPCPPRCGKDNSLNGNAE
ncbi:MAG: hypothetical protein IAF38_22230 [Bacteroidia bacterium]|nr:hypothetical protein [Bacteroidia bacterium]